MVAGALVSEHDCLAKQRPTIDYRAIMISAANPPLSGKETPMKRLFLTLVLGVGAWLFAAGSANAQYPFMPRLYPTHYYGYPVAPYLNNFGYGYNYVGGPFAEFRSTAYNPFTGYYITQVRGVSSPFGYYTGYYRGFGSPVGTYTVQYVPSYYSPSFFRPMYSGAAYYNVPSY
jgi:hypothetical protein